MDLPDDIAAIISDFLTAQEFVYTIKNTSVNVPERYFHSRLTELEKYVQDVKIPTQKQYLEEAKTSQRTKLDFFINKYTDLGGILSDSYAILIDIRVCCQRAAIKGDVDLVKYFLNVTDTLIQSLPDDILNHPHREDWKKNIINLVYSTAAQRNQQNLIQILTKEKYGRPGVGEFEEAAKNGHFELVLFLVQFITDEHPILLSSSLYHAAQSKNAKVVEYILNNITTADIQMSLEVAGNVQIAQLLINRGATVNQRNFRKAIDRSDLKLMEFFLETNPQLDLNKAMELAAYDGELAAVKFLLEKGATNIEHSYRSARSRYRQQRRTKNRIVMDFLNEYRSFLSLHVTKGNIKQVQTYLQENKLNVQQTRRLFTDCVDYNQLDMLRFLYETANNKEIKLPLYLMGTAIREKNLPMIDYLYGEDVKITPSALEKAVQTEDVKTVQFILDKTDNRQTGSAAYKAVTLGNIEIVRMLDFEIVQQLLELAAKRGHVDIVLYILNSTEFKATNTVLNKALASAAKNNQYKTAVLLLEKGADPNTALKELGRLNKDLSMYVLLTQFKQ